MKKENIRKEILRMEKIVNYNGINFKVVINKEDLIKQAKELEEFEQV